MIFVPRKTRKPKTLDVLVPDTNVEPMRGVFPTVTQAEEARLRAEGYMPVLRWALVGGSGGLSEKVVKTADALKTLAQRDRRRAAAARAWAARRARRKK